MKKKYVLIIILLIIIIVSCIGIVIKSNQKNNDDKQNGENLNEITIEGNVIAINENMIMVDSEKLKEKRTIGNLTVNEIRITSQDKDLSMTLSITNETEKTQGNKDITIIAKKKNGEEIGKIALNIGEIMANNTIAVELKIGYEYINTYDIEILDQPLLME